MSAINIQPAKICQQNIISPYEIYGILIFNENNEIYE